MSETLARSSAGSATTGLDTPSATADSVRAGPGWPAVHPHRIKGAHRVRWIGGAWRASGNPVQSPIAEARVST